jgi:hypothetical protein
VVGERAGGAAAAVEQLGQARQRGQGGAPDPLAE